MSRDFRIVEGVEGVEIVLDGGKSEDDSNCDCDYFVEGVEIVLFGGRSIND